MYMFVRFDEKLAMTLQDIKETKRYGRTHALTEEQRENRIPTTNNVCGGYKDLNKILYLYFLHKRSRCNLSILSRMKFCFV